MKRIFCFLALFCRLEAQGQALTIGDRLPDIALQQINRLVATNAAPNGIKPVIVLDFFATWCGSCIGLLPKLEQLDLQMKDSLAVLVVSPQGVKEIGLLIKSRAPKLPFLASDSLLGQLFPHRLLPHEVWIQDGVVKAITLPDELEPGNIRKLVAGGEISLTIKKDILRYDPSEPFSSYFDVPKKPGEPLLYGKLEGAPGGRGEHKLEDGKRRYFINQPMLSLIHFATGAPYNLFSYDLTDTLWLDYKDRGLKKYCYEQYVKAGVGDREAGMAMLAELNNAGPLTAHWEKQQSDCYIISVIPGAQINCLSGGNPRHVSYDSGRVHTTFTNVPLSRITGEFTESAIPVMRLPIMLDETGISGNLDLTLPTAALKNIWLLDQALRPYGLMIQFGKRAIDRLVITDKKLRTPKPKK